MRVVTYVLVPPSSLPGLPTPSQLGVWMKGPTGNLNV